MVQHIKDMDEFKAFLKDAGHRLVVIEFSAKWCGPCKDMRPIFRALSLRYQNVRFANVDVDDSPELAETCHIKALPTFQMFKQIQKVTLFSRIKRTCCCYRRGTTVQQYLEDYGNEE
uniref:Thioredoxin domain containing 8 n=1 Tax=Sciurus vulgaris TaxID=55149 RepID=A0A8D2JLU6_SCIVU